MRVTIGQINTTNGDYEGNTAGIIRAIEQAKKDAADLVVLPEVAVQGYTSLDWFLDRDVTRCVLQPLDRIMAATKGLTAIVGTVRPTELANGRKLYNSAAIIRDQKLLGFADKTLLPEYDVFDDPRYFEPARERHLFAIDDCNLGVTVCEDFWNDKTFWRERLYTNDPADELIEMGASVLISINASPFNKGKMAKKKTPPTFVIFKIFVGKCRCTGVLPVFTTISPDFLINFLSFKISIWSKIYHPGFLLHHNKKPLHPNSGSID